ncbi:putative ribonuclease H protein At1g65750 [Raphanus sativus]|uniref:Ribonuclease H protein At1g65750 n=1 Tax=Raphanus sativus TaxID=3726 RepID=A0A6J0LZL8_RAPSA|nr:putative ribonuclease H protein At1g65750 [Raphanus sativus]
MSRFWWEKSATQKGIPWVAWDRMQFPKCQGGMGFKNLCKFNDALLARQAWRLVQYPNSVMAKLFKARYFKDSHILQASSKRYQSYGWSSLMVGINLLKQGSRFIIGNGKSVRLYEDHWLPTEPPRCATRMCNRQHLMVSDIIVATSTFQHWNLDTAQQLLNDEYFQLMLTIYLPQTKIEDTLVWPLEASGNYTVKSGYKREMMELGRQLPDLLPPRGDPVLKTKIWKLPIIPKLKHFLWRILTLALGTNTRLNTGGMSLDCLCSRCSDAPETVNHLFFLCPISVQTWRSNQVTLGFSARFTDDLENNMEYLLQLQSSSTLTMEQKLTPFWLLWKIWKSRNNLIFKNKIINPQRDGEYVTVEVRDWLEKTAQVSSTPRQIPLSPRWYPPMIPYYKCNFDAAYNPQTFHASAGWVIRDCYGVVHYWAMAFLGSAQSPLEAESKALLAAIQCAFALGYKNMIFEGDCLVLINSLTTGKGDFSIAMICNDIRHWGRKLGLLQFARVPREANVVAHMLATRCDPTVLFTSSSTFIPHWLTNVICNDYIRCA